MEPPRRGPPGPRRSCSRRGVLLGAPPALSAATAPLWLPGMAPPPAEAAAAAAAAAAAEASVGRGRLAPGLEVSQVVKGCAFPLRRPMGLGATDGLAAGWQLSGGHRGDRKTDRTAGKAAVADFTAFEKAGITTFDTADIYGPSQELIGEFIKQRGNGSEGLQVLTKFCCFGPEMQNMTSKFVERGIDDSRRKLGIDDLDLVQVSESVRRAAPATDPPHQVLLA